MAMLDLALEGLSVFGLILFLVIWPCGPDRTGPRAGSAPPPAGRSLPTAALGGCDHEVELQSRSELQPQGGYYSFPIMAISAFVTVGEKLVWLSTALEFQKATIAKRYAHRTNRELDKKQKTKFENKVAI